MTYNIRSDIKIPSLGNHNRYPFGEMKVGDSFAVPLEDRKRVSAAASMYATRNNVKFTIRTVERNNKTYRCWRIK